jgi:hypothetical protein
LHLLIGRAVAALVFTATFLVSGMAGHPAHAAPAPALEPRALDLLQATTSRLNGAKGFSFRTRNVPGSAGGSGPFASFFAHAQFAVLRPNKVRAKVRGDAPPLDVFFDGTTLTVYQPTLNLYANTDQPGTLEALIPFALQRAGVLFPLADVLAGDPQTTMTRRITRARFKGVATIAGKQCEHAAFAAPGVDWELWIDARNSLPCRLTGSLLDMQGAPRFAVDFFDWKLNPPLSAKSFAFAKPPGAGQLDFRALMGQ